MINDTTLLGAVIKLETGTGVRVNVAIHEIEGYNGECMVDCNVCERVIANMVPNEECAIELADLHMSHRH